MAFKIDELYFTFSYYLISGIMYLSVFAVILIYVNACSFENNFAIAIYIWVSLKLLKYMLFLCYVLFYVEPNF